MGLWGAGVCLGVERSATSSLFPTYGCRAPRPVRCVGATAKFKDDFGGGLSF